MYPVRYTKLFLLFFCISSVLHTIPKCYREQALRQLSFRIHKLYGASLLIIDNEKYLQLVLATVIMFATSDHKPDNLSHYIRYSHIHVIR